MNRMTEKFKQYIIDFTDEISRDERITAAYDEEYNVTIAYNNRRVLLLTENLEEYYNMFAYGRVNYTSAVIRGVAIVKKDILGLEDSND